jgi:hypothetical protein
MRPYVCITAWAKPYNGQGGSRTPDTRIFSPVLYQLSYLPAMDACQFKVWRRGCQPPPAGLLAFELLASVERMDRIVA